MSANDNQSQNPPAPSATFHFLNGTSFRTKRDILSRRPSAATLAGWPMTTRSSFRITSWKVSMPTPFGPGTRRASSPSTSSCDRRTEMPPDVARVVSRLKIPTMFMFPLIQALNANMTEYEQTYEEIK